MSQLPQKGYGLRSFIRHEVFEIIVIEGEGIKEDPVRAVTYWLLEDGTLLVRNDPRDLLVAET